MIPPQPMPLSGTRCSVTYHLTGTEEEARAKAEALCLDQTVELPDDLVPAGVIHEQIVGCVESFRQLTSGKHEVVIGFPSELVGSEFTQLLNLVFGISSLKPGIRVARLLLPDSVVRSWPGPRFGRTGLRERVGVHDRPLVCGVLKPVGLSVEELAELAYQFALGGLDLVKDDQGLFDQGFCPFEERVTRCAEAVAKANRQTGRRCLYLPHVTGSWEVMRRRCFIAKQAGAGGIMICPGLTGFDAVTDLARDDTLTLPIVTHPTFLGSYMVDPTSGIAPAVLFGQLPRLAGADATIYPTYGGNFPVSQEDCRQIASATAIPWGHLKTIFPTAAGRVNSEQVREICEFYQGQVMIMVGGGFIRPGGDVVMVCRAFIDKVIHCSQA